MLPGELQDVQQHFRQQQHHLPTPHATLLIDLCFSHRPSDNAVLVGEYSYKLRLARGVYLSPNLTLVKQREHRALALGVHVQWAAGLK